MTKTKAMLLISVLLLWPARAEAWWGWLEEMSGPGPFKSPEPGILATACFPSGLKPTPSPLSSGDRKLIPCIYADTARFNVDEDKTRGFPAIGAHLADFGGSVRFADFLDVGAGFGWIAFDSNLTDETHRKFTLTPVRFVARPLVLLRPKIKQLGIFSFYWKYVFIKGPITGEDFDVDRSKFDSDGEGLKSYGFILDLTALLPTNWITR